MSSSQIQKFEYLEKENSFLDEKNNIFYFNITYNIIYNILII